MTPTLICFLSPSSRLNCRSRLMSAPLPKLLFRLAWKASVGRSEESAFTHLRATHAGTRSHLFTMNTRCLWAACFFR